MLAFSFFARMEPMKRLVAMVILSIAPAAVSQTVQQTTDRFVDEALASQESWRVVEHLADEIGPRLSGSRGHERAIEFTAAQFRAWGISVRLEPVIVPHWVRGEEEAVLVSHHATRLRLTTLGRSVATPAEGITAEVVEVRSMAELETRKNEIPGRIVLFNEPMDARVVAQHRAESAYGAAAPQRTRGASAAAKRGAVAVLVRSLTTRSLRTPHTGAVGYDEKLPKIPAAAIATEDADLIHRLMSKGERVVVKLRLSPQTLPDAPSANVIAEIPGREKPEEIIVIGGHLDSWDNGRGAIDNGSGVAVVMDAMRIIQASGLQPRRTIRAVLFANEENGRMGGKTYAKDNNDDLWRHVAAIEHDLGAGAPMGFRTTLEPAEIERLQPWVGSLARLGALRFSTERSVGADTSPLVGGCVTGFGAMPDATSYFDYHHSEADTLDKVDPELLRENVAAMVVLTWALAEMPERVR